MISRITHLIETNKEEGVSRTDPKSLFDLTKFLDSHYNFKSPSLTLTPHGTFRCTWKDDDYNFAVEFFGNDIIKYIFSVKLASGKILRLKDVADIKFVETLISQIH